MTGNIGERFQEETKYHRSTMPQGSLNWKKKPDIYKEYTEARIIELIRPEKCGDMTLYEAMLRRKSIREFLDVAVSLDALSCVLWSACGIQRREMGFEFRMAPSAGGLYPIETYVVANKVEGVEQGVYHYNVKHNCLEELKLGDFRAEAVRAALGQTMCASASAVIIWTAIFYRSGWKYADRAYRYVYLDAGHIAQNLALASTSLGLGCCQVGAFCDDDVNRLVDVDGIQEGVLYMSVIGHPGMVV